MESIYSRIGHEDVERSSIIRRIGRSKRWTPQWANDDRKVRLVVYHHLYRYVLGLGPRVTMDIKPGISLLELEKLAARQRERVGQSQKPFNGFDAHLTSVSHRGTAALFTSLIYKAYRQRMPSPDIAEELGMSRGAVRQYLHRFNTVARELFQETEIFAPRSGSSPSRVKGTRGRCDKPVSQSAWAAAKAACSERRDARRNRNEAIKKMHQAGKSLREIVDASGASESIVYNVLYRGGLHAPRPQGINLRDEQMASKREQGATLKEIGAEFGMCGYTVLRRLRRLKLGSSLVSRERMKNDPRTQQMIARREQGASYGVIGAEFGLSGQNVRYRIVRADFNG